MHNITSDVESVIHSYPEALQDKLIVLRNIIIDVAKELKLLDVLEETLKWNEPSYLVKAGSTIRIAWKQSSPDQYGMFFNCKTNLVETFKEIYGDVFHFEGNRAIIFELNDNVPIDELKHCIRLALTYHKIKHLPMLGV